MYNILFVTKVKLVYAILCAHKNYAASNFISFYWWLMLREELPESIPDPVHKVHVVIRVPEHEVTGVKVLVTL